MKKVNQIFIILFIACLLIPALTMPFFRNSENTEKRELASRPVLFTDGKINENLGTDTEAWLSDHIGFRNMMVSVNNRLQSSLFNRSTVSSVIIGKDGWLYYADDLNDYLNIATLTERNAGNIARTYAMVQNALDNSGRSFIFAAVPNKSSLYDYMPAYYVPLMEKGNIELLQEAFDKYGVSHADLLAGFKALPEELYRKTDTHWSYKGALEAWRMMVTYETFDNISFTDRKDAEGDLAVMLYSTAAEPDVQSYPDMDFSFEYISHEKKPDALLLTTYNPKGRGNLLMYRDSYGDTLHVFAAETAENAVFSRVVPYNISYAEQYDADTVVLEIVERNLPNLAEKAPLMAAPEISLEIKAVTGNPEQIKVFSKEDGEYLHIYGEIDSTLLGEEYRVYVMLKGDEDLSFEAFPIYEKELMQESPGETAETEKTGASKARDNGFSAYIPIGNAEGKSMAIIVESKGAAYYFHKGE